MRQVETFTLANNAKFVHIVSVSLRSGNEMCFQREVLCLHCSFDMWLIYSTLKSINILRKWRVCTRSVMPILGWNWQSSREKPCLVSPRNCVLTHSITKRFIAFDQFKLFISPLIIIVIILCLVEVSLSQPVCWYLLLCWRHGSSYMDHPGGAAP